MEKMNANDAVFYYGVRENYQVGDLIRLAFDDGREDEPPFLYFTSSMDAAIWAAELSMEKSPERIYKVVPTGVYKEDSGIAQAYKTKHPLKVVEEVLEWVGHDPAKVKGIKQDMETKFEEGFDAIG
jgi:rifampin ADP-ribosylating transferase